MGWGERPEWCPPVIDGYEVVGCLTTTSYSVLLRVIDPGLGQTLVLKTLQPAEVTEETSRRLRHEFECLSALAEDGFVRVHRLGTLTRVSGGTQPYFVMDELTSALTIHQHVLDLGLSTRERLLLFDAVLERMCAAHRKGILHRDLKPRNILVDEAGRVWVIDFNVARSTSSGTAWDLRRDDLRAKVGTPAYMSPEQFAAAAATIDARTDVYSLAVVLHELLTGTLPYDLGGRMHWHEVAEIVQHTPARMLPQLDPALDDRLRDLMACALAKDREHRFQTLQHMRDELRATLDLTPLGSGTHRVPRADTHQRPVPSEVTPRRPTWWWAGSIAAAALVAAAAAGDPGRALMLWRPGGTPSIEERFQSFLVPGGVASGADLARVLVVAEPEGFDAEACAQKAGIEGVHGSPRPLRRLLAAALERIAGTTARGVAIDYYFKGDSPDDDERLVKAIDLLRAHRLPMVIGATAWRPVGSVPVVCGTLAPHVRVGGLTMQPHTHVPWELDLVVQGPGEPARASLALAAAAAATRRDAEPWYSLTSVPPAAGVTFFESGRAPVLGAEALGPPFYFPLTGVRSWQPGVDKLETGLKSGDTIGSLTITIPPDDRLAASTVTIEAFLLASPDRLRSLVDGRVVLFGPLNPKKDPEADSWPTVLDDGRARPVAPVYAHASGIEALLASSGPATQVPDNMLYSMWCAAGALAGSVIGVLDIRRGTRAILMLATSALAAATSAIAFATGGVLLNPVTAILACVLSCLLVCTLRRVVGIARNDARGTLAAEGATS